jgi:DNA-binding transcriptional regulator YiaG
MKPKVYTVEEEVLIPNLEGDGIAERIKVKIPVVRDAHTGETVLTEEAFRILETIKARHMGLLLPDQIKSLRTRLRLTQKEMSQLLQAGEKSYTRWETGRARPSRMVNVLLRLLDSGDISIEALRRQRAGIAPHISSDAPALRPINRDEAVANAIAQTTSPRPAILDDDENDLVDWDVDFLPPPSPSQMVALRFREAGPAPLPKWTDEVVVEE